MNALVLALIQLEREGRNPSAKNYGMLWERRVYQIQNYLMKGKGNEGINRRKIK
jgi:hypothetical protein